LGWAGAFLIDIIISCRKDFLIIRSEVSQLRFRKYMVVYFVTVRGIVLPKRQALAGIETDTKFYQGICHPSCHVE
jgi:hypothetical protein